MDVITTIAELRARLDERRATGASVGLVPTMGYLHDGHRSLVQASAANADLSVVSIFVNPLQFAAGEDLSAYPRDLEADLAMIDEAGGDVVFTPSAEEMYPTPPTTSVRVDGVSAGMEGASRPTHFAGVATVVAKLFLIVGRCQSFLGEKDYQQLAVIRRMVTDLNFDVEVIGCPTKREPDGLAMSSRNVYLTAEERRAAPIIHRALTHGAELIAAGETDADVIRLAISGLVRTEPLAQLDYVEVADAETLEPLDRCDATARLFAAVRFGRARLIDNIGVSV